jgi:Xaa-Pro dipeptidase
MQERLAALYPIHVATLEQRWSVALEQSGFDRVAIFAGAQHMIFLDDMPYPFKVNPHFKAWLPVLDNPNCLLLYTPGQQPLLAHYQPVDYWHKPAEDPQGYWVDQFEIRSVPSLADAKSILPQNGRTAWIGESPEEVAGWPFAEVNPKRLLDHIHYDRSHKTEYEIECMREANRRGALGHRAAERAFRTGASEYDIHVEYLKATSHAEHELPYGNIIALNEHGAILHYQHLRRDGGQERHSFLIDAGATMNGYASDITRTYSAHDDEFAELIAAMDAAQQEICAAVRPGVDYPDLHLLAHRQVARLLVRFGFVDLSEEEAVARGVTSTFLPHGVGHFIGLQVHDVAGFLTSRTGPTRPAPEEHPFLRLTRVVEEKQVFTIEPGFYFIPTLLADLRESDSGRHVRWEKVDRFRKYGGIRVEDDLAVTADGAENLTRNAFEELVDGSPPRPPSADSDAM